MMPAEARSSNKTPSPEPTSLPRRGNGNSAPLAGRGPPTGPADAPTGASGAGGLGRGPAAPPRPPKWRLRHARGANR
eukprot:4120739-Alexandrium_andersonii.AAC.1